MAATPRALSPRSLATPPLTPQPLTPASTPPHAGATRAASGSISDHASAGDAALRRGFGPRVRRLHARIGKAHHQAEGMGFSRALLAGQASPLQLAEHAAAILAAHGLPALAFWSFAASIPELKQRLHDGFEALELSAAQEEELLQEAELAFLATQRLLAELGELATAGIPSPADTGGDPALERSTGGLSGLTLELLLKYDRPVPRYTSYPTAAAFSPAVGAADLAELLRQGRANQPLSLYVHVPFCRHACWYCGCNKVTTQAGSKAVTPYLEALEKELELIAAVGGPRRRLAQLHWGGGTPNDLSPLEISRLWQLVAAHFDLEPDLEASIEVNPELLDRDQGLHLRRLGFNRISFGIQDADPDVQQLPLQRRIAAEELPSQRQRLTMLEQACSLFTGSGWEAIGMDHYALAGDSLADRGSVAVTGSSRWLIRTVAAVFEPSQRLQASGSRLI